MPYITKREAAEILNVSQRTVSNYIAQGIVPGYRVGPRLMRLRREDVEALVVLEAPGTSSAIGGHAGVRS